MTKKTTLTTGITAIATLFLLVNITHGATSLIVQSVFTEQVGTTSDVPGGGSSSNFPIGTALPDGSYSASFRLAQDDGMSIPYADLKVTLVGINGTLDSPSPTNQSGLMIAQTTNSQGLTDAGTISVLADLLTTGTGGDSSITLRFELFTPDGNFTTPFSSNIGITSYDLDFNQFNSFSSSDLTSVTLDGSTALTIDQTGNDVSIEAPSGSSAYNNAQHAYSAETNNINSFDMTMGKIASSGPALFMFEFRTPSDHITYTAPTVTSVPEPSASLLLMLALGICAQRRNRPL